MFHLNERSITFRRYAGILSNATCISFLIQLWYREAARTIVTFVIKMHSLKVADHFTHKKVDAALAEIDRLPGRHLYFLDDHLLGNQKFSSALFQGMRGMGRVFQGASTVDAILRGDLIEEAAAAGLRSVSIGFETLNESNLQQSNKKQNLVKIILKRSPACIHWA